jgi:putative endonuclease
VRDGCAVGYPPSVTQARRQCGREGEELAAAFLCARGHVLVERNYRCPRGEIDLVTRDGPTLVFCEVRTRRSTLAGPAVESITRRKQQRILAVARCYLAERGPRARVLRFDVVAVEMRGPVVRVEHLADAFRAD